MYSEIKAIGQGSGTAVANVVNGLIKEGWEVIGPIQGFSEPDGRAFFYATMGKRHGIQKEYELAAAAERDRIIQLVLSHEWTTRAGLITKIMEGAKC